MKSEDFLKKASWNYDEIFLFKGENDDNDWFRRDELEYKNMQ